MTPNPGPDGWRGPLPDITIPDVTLFDLVFGDLSEADAGKLAALDHASGVRLTVGDVRDQALAFATWLADRGVGAGDAVGVYLPNLPAYLPIFHGIARAGAAVAPINASYPAPEIGRQLSATGARVLVTCDALADAAIAGAAAAGLQPNDLVVVGAGGGETHAWASVSATPANPPAQDYDPATQLACLPFSSGTSGLPKPVMLTHRNLVANLLQFHEVLAPLGGDTSLVAFLPYSHIYALTTNLHYGLLCRTPQYTMSGFDPMAFLQIIATYRPALLFVVPPVAAFLAKHPAVAQADLSSVRLIVSGAAPLDTATGDALAARVGCRVVQGYGMTELSPVTHVIPLDRTDIDLGTIGPAIPNIRFRVVDPETGRDVAVPEPGTWSAPGELWITGPNAMRGYLGVPADADAVLDADGWVHTGDLAAVNSEGVVRIVDRIKELIKRRGLQVAPAELEAILGEHPAVADAAVVGVASSTPGEQVPHALVVLRPGAEATASELATFLAERVAPHKRLGGVQFVSQVPRSAAGKILRRQLPELLKRP